MRPSEVLTSVLLFSSACSAWPFGWDTQQAVKREIAPLVKRQTTYNLSYSSVQGNTATTVQSATATATDDSNSDSGDATSTDGDVTATGSETGLTTGTAKVTASPTKKTGGGNETSTFDPATISPQAPAGGIQMLTPNVYTTQYYKISDYVTFAWNYTSVSSMPSAVDILATCARNAATYTLALNESVTASTQAFTWDTNQYQATATIQLLTETYTLIVYDAAKDVSATPSPGYLGTSKQFTFGMYNKQPYENDQPMKCATCKSRSAAMTQAERQTVCAVLGMAGLTVLSFGWFTGVAGLW